MQLQRHGWDIHIVSTDGPVARTTGAGRAGPGLPWLSPTEWRHRPRTYRSGNPGRRRDAGTQPPTATPEPPVAVLARSVPVPPRRVSARPVWAGTGRLSSSVQPVLVPVQPIRASAQPVLAPMQAFRASAQPVLAPMQPFRALAQAVLALAQAVLAPVQPIRAPVHAARAQVRWPRAASTRARGRAQPPGACCSTSGPSG
jgi:hypothetical protein